MLSIRYGHKLCFWQRIRLWNRHKNLTEALGTNGKKFSRKYFPPIWTDQTYINVDYDTLLDRLLMFVTYCAQELKCNVRSIPSIMSALRHGMVSRLVKCCNAFDNELLKIRQARHCSYASSGAPNTVALYIGHDKAHCCSKHATWCIHAPSHVGNRSVRRILLLLALK